MRRYEYSPITTLIPLSTSDDMEELQPDGIEAIYLTLEDILGLYGLIIDATHLEAANQLRNREGLESTLARPHTYMLYEENTDFALQATVLAHGLAEGQHFLDGNKRIALVAMLTFLEINHFSVNASDPELADWIISFSAGATPDEIAKLLRPRLRNID
jgi:death on curing protein